MNCLRTRHSKSCTWLALQSPASAFSSTSRVSQNRHYHWTLSNDSQRVAELDCACSPRVVWVVTAMTRHCERSPVLSCVNCESPCLTLLLLLACWDCVAWSTWRSCIWARDQYWDKCSCNSKKQALNCCAKIRTSIRPARTVYCKYFIVQRWVSRILSHINPCELHSGYLKGFYSFHQRCPYKHRCCVDCIVFFAAVSGTNNLHETS